MPKRTDLKSILIIGAGPIVIGQACEFDYSGAQACKALREEGYKVILVNSNPATIMTDPEMADVTYIEPIMWQTKDFGQDKPIFSIASLKRPRSSALSIASSVAPINSTLYFANTPLRAKSSAQFSAV